VLDMVGIEHVVGKRTRRSYGSAVMVNASTRFTDGREFGGRRGNRYLDREAHARGPMGLSELTSTKYMETGYGHLRG
jgi:glutamate-5-semialdehyde dehydrogenase